MKHHPPPFHSRPKSSWQRAMKPLREIILLVRKYSCSVLVSRRQRHKRPARRAVRADAAAEFSVHVLRARRSVENRPAIHALEIKKISGVVFDVQRFGARLGCRFARGLVCFFFFIANPFAVHLHPITFSVPAGHSGCKLLCSNALSAYCPPFGLLRNFASCEISL